MSEWQPIESAPRDGTHFLAYNHDGELWLAKFIDGDRLVFRHNHRREMRKFEIRTFDGESWMKEDEEYREANEKWSSAWTYWTRLYDFKPTHWTIAPQPPEAA